MTNAKGTKSMSGGMDQREFYALIRSQLPKQHQDAASVISRVNQHYVSTARDDNLAESFSKFVAWVTAEQNHGQVGKGYAFYVTGESGAGKTNIIKNLINTHPALTPIETPIGIISPCISVSLPGPATLKNLALSILGAAGYEIANTKTESYLWNEMPKILKSTATLFVHIDEFQHLFHPGYDADGVVKYIKGLMNNPAWPVSFIIAGMPEVRNLLIEDEQAQRRNNSFTLPSLVMPKHRSMVHFIIKSLSREGDLSVEDLLKTDVPDRVARAANYQFGRICEVTISAIYEAAIKNEKVLAREHFARAYKEHSDARYQRSMNPFLSDDWESLEPGYFIRKKLDEQDDGRNGF